jgi:enoyl reductase
VPDLREVRSTACAVTAGLVLTLVTTVNASANETPGQGHQQGGKNGQNIDASAYSVSYEPASPPAGHPLTATDGWMPPACWLAPVATPQELKVEREGVWAEDSTGYVWDAAQRDYYVNGHPHKDFEIANADKGMWWNGQVNPNRLADAASLSCFKERDDWVLNGATPPAGPVVTPQVLAESAYDRIRIPDKVVSLSPDAQHTQTVNLSTWAWLDSTSIPPVSVTARLNSLNIWATTTARPVGLHLNAGTPDADLYPSSGDCAKNTDGSIGAKYRTGDGNTPPPCGLVYRRSSGGGTFPLTATITWQVSWVGSGSTGGNLTDGVFDTTQDVTVQEIQTVNR